VAEGEEEQAKRERAIEAKRAWVVFMFARTGHREQRAREVSRQTKWPGSSHLLRGRRLEKCNLMSKKLQKYPPEDFSDNLRRLPPSTRLACEIFGVVHLEVHGGLTPQPPLLYGEGENLGISRTCAPLSR
jgi:hypothetical protein